METHKPLNGQLRIAILLSLTLGLAPFFPEPYIWGKLKWLWGGGVGMETMDHLDMVLHGSPWLFFDGNVNPNWVKKTESWSLIH